MQIEGGMGTHPGILSEIRRQDAGIVAPQRPVDCLHAFLREQLIAPGAMAVGIYEPRVRRQVAVQERPVVESARALIIQAKQIAGGILEVLAAVGRYHGMLNHDRLS